MRKIDFIRQFTNETCGISCLQMILHHFGADRISRPSQRIYRTKQQLLYDHYGVKETPETADMPMAGTLGAAIAYALYQRGLHVTLAHASERLLNNDGDYFPAAMYEALLAQHLSYIEKAEALRDFYAQAAVEHSMPHLLPNGSYTLEKGVPITCTRLRTELLHNRLVIVQILVDGNADGMHDQVMHWILLCDCDATGFLAMDPSTGAKQYTDEALINSMQTPFGSTFISVGKDG